MKNSKSPAAAKRTSSTLSGADLLVRALELAGVDTVFAYPGGNSMLFHQALTRSKQIRTILPRHEQGGAFMA
ncbi:MAG: acetolactate synthase, partial [Verrucomicrobiales bacterium]|nr:acetolactate synthase [Verrucomicrobiales bacterium]